MADEKTLKLKIELDGYIMPGVIDAQKELAAAAKKAASKMGVLNVSADDLKRTLDELKKKSDDADDGVKKLGKGGKEAGEKLSKMELRKLGNEFGNLAGLGNLSALAIGGIAAAAFAAAKAIEFLKNTYADIQAAIKGPITIEAVSKVDVDVAKIQAATTAWNQYAEAGLKVIEADSTAQANFARENTVLSARLKLLEDILKVEEREAMAALAGKKDKMTPEAYARAQNQIKTAFAGKEAQASDEDAQARIQAMQHEKETLEQSAKDKKEKAAEISTGDDAAVDKAQANSEEAKKSLDEIKKHRELLDRLDHPDTAYGGDNFASKVMGMAQQQEDIYEFRKRYGADSSLADASKIESQYEGQAISAIGLADRAKSEQERRKKAKSDLLTQAGTEEGQAEVIGQDIIDAQDAANKKGAVSTGTQDIAAATTALAQEAAVEANATTTKLADARAALQDGQAAARGVIDDIKNVGDSNKELHAALERALADLAEANKKLSAKINNGSFNSR
jgi:hypothetical protein